MAATRERAANDEASRETAERAAGVLAPEATLFEDSDSAGLGEALRIAFWSSVTDPAGTARATSQLITDLARIPLHTATRWVGGEVQTHVPIDPKDRRFADPAWTTNPFFQDLRLAYLTACRYARDLVRSAAVEPDIARKAELAIGFALDAAAPTNFLPTNPAALKRAFETAGGSLVRGAANFVDDLLNNEGRPRQVDTSGFTVGGNLAATPGKVVFRNQLMELIQYSSQTAKVHERPLLCSPPWINKYYVMDLAPGRSFIEWAVQHGRTVFAISYLNPSTDMSGTTLDDYLIHGPHTALDVIQAITGVDTIDIVGLCLGGALTAIAAAYLRQTGDTRIGSITLINTMLDYADPGDVAAFTDGPSVERLARKISKSGALEGKSMTGTFDVLRANDLIFGYVVSNWLMGQDPPAFDILAWNSDSTRMPAAMHTFYLRNFYVRNKLAAGTLEIAGKVIDLSAIDSPTYVVSAINDHIVPWPSAYKTTGLVSGPVRFVLSSGGHIAGIVNPPHPKAWFVTDDGDRSKWPEAAEYWRESAQRQAGSWWQDWTNWSAETAGELIDPPAAGNDQYPVLGDAPGEYVHS